MNIGGIPFSPVPDNDQWDMITKAWAATPKKELTATYNEGPPAVITKVSGA